MLHHILVTSNTRDTHFKSIHDIVGQKPNSSFQTKAFLTPIKTDKTMGPYYIHEGEKKIKELEKKNGGKGLKGEKVARLTFALVFR